MFDIEWCLDLFKDYPKLPKITQNYQKITRYQGLKRVKKGRVIGNFGKLPGNYQVIQGNYPKLPITRVCRVRSYLVISNQAMKYFTTLVWNTLPKLFSRCLLYFSLILSIYCRVCGHPLSISRTLSKKLIRVPNSASPYSIVSSQVLALSIKSIRVSPLSFLDGP